MIRKLFAAVLPPCTYCPDKIATWEQWNFLLCDLCAERVRRSGIDIPMTEFSYADAVRELEKEE